MIYDVAIAGLGAMGSAAAFHLARRGVRVAGFDREHPPHTLGSTHGRSRIIREAYFEDPAYVPLIQRAYELWADLERERGERLLIQTGGLMCGPESGVIVDGALRSAREHGLPHEVLSAHEIGRRFPAFAPDDDWVGIVEPRAGMLLPEPCVAAHLDLAARAGADLHFNEAVLSWESAANGIEVRTGRTRVVARKLILAAGAWLTELAPELQGVVEVERQMLHWFRPLRDASLCAADRCPIALFEWEPGRLVATFPDTGDGVKIGVHHEGEVTTPATVRRTTSTDEDRAIRMLLARVMPPAAGEQIESRVCLYTNTRDHHFLVDAHPAHADVIVASPCSGHGFKFASAIGEVLADLALDGGSRFDLSLFGLARERSAAAI